jgi:hypothetical protein
MSKLQMDFTSVNETGEPQEKMRSHHSTSDRDDHDEGGAFSFADALSAWRVKLYSDRHTL